MDVPPRRGARLILEGAVILFSILAAFFLENWREDREEQRELTLELVSVRQELARNRDLIDVTVGNFRRMASAGDDLMARLENSDAAYVAVPDTIAFMGAGWASSTDLSLGAVKALIASGRLALVRDAELRLGLAGLEDTARDAIEEELSAREVLVDHIYPMFGEKTDIAPIDRVIRGFFDTPETVAGLTITDGLSQRAMPSFGHFQFPNDRPMRNATRLRLIWLLNARDEAERLDVYLLRLLELLDAELG